jgi:hypothetical protein
MGRSLFAVIAGYLSVIFFNSFVRFVISVYSKANVSLSGVADLPSALLMYLFTAAGFLFGLIGGLITCSIVNDDAKIEILALIILIVTAGLFAYHFTGNAEPLWYLISAPLLKMGGIFTAYYLKLEQDEIN